MKRATKIIPNLYRDSVSLMQLSDTLARRPGVGKASVVMATEANIGLLHDAGFLDKRVDASPNDLLIVLLGDDDAALAAALTAAESGLHEEPATGAGGPAAQPPRSIEMALAANPGANFALISTPGEYAAAEAMKALRLGMSVMIFSDNVPIGDEVALKQLARERGLLAMGPDCGTAIINGVPLAFANVVRRGEIGCIGASGTGLQQVTCLVDRLGLGISQAIGTGSHDLSKEVGGITMLAGIEALGADPQTKVIVLISKPPAAEVADRVLAAASRVGKPVVVIFVGADPAGIARPNLFAVKTLADAAATAVALARGQAPNAAAAPRAAASPAPAFKDSQRYVRGLYSGGTFCYEASLLLGEVLSENPNEKAGEANRQAGRVWSNAPVRKSDLLDDLWHSREHTVIDLGDDVFTRGRPHPMIDHRLRSERMVQEASDPQVAVILLDIVLGYGSHADPAGEVVSAMKASREAAAKDGRTVAFVGFVCGTPADPQDLSRQEAALESAGMLLAGSNADAVRLSARLIEGSHAGARGAK